MTSLSDLLAAQEQHMGSVRRALSNFKKLGQAKMTAAVTAQRLEKLRSTFTKCEELDAAILAASDVKSRSTLLYFVQGAFVECEAAFDEAADFMAEMLAIAQEGKAVAGTSRSSDACPRNASRLPSLHLPTFDGTFRQWETFRDKFVSLIIQEPSLSNVERMHYLTSCVMGDASAVLRHLAVTDANFPVAWKMLTSRYENKRKLIFNHLHALYTLPRVSSETSKQLRDLRDRTSSALHALENLGRPVKMWDDILVYLLTQRLDAATRKAWELQLGDSSEYPAYATLNRFLDSRICALEFIPEVRDSKVSIGSSVSARAEKPRSMPTLSATITSLCPICKASHLIYQCDQFQNQSPSQRFDNIKSLKRCINCFSAKHAVKDCTSTRSCKQCRKRHHTLLHFENMIAPIVNPLSSHDSETEELKESVPVLLNSRCTDVFKQTLLATARVRVYSPRGQFVIACALIDQGSAVSLITERVVQFLHLSKIRRSIRISGVGDNGSTVKHAVEISITPVTNKELSFPTTALVLRTLTKYAPRRVTVENPWSHLSDLTLADNDPLSSDPIDLLIGADLFSQLLCDGIRKGGADQPVAQNTALGWIISGTMNPSSIIPVAHTHHLTFLDRLDQSIRRFWETEELPEKRHLSPEEKQCEEYFLATHSRTPCGRYIVRLPFKDDGFPEFGESRRAAESQLIRVERGLQRDIERYSAYQKFLEEYLKSQHMEKAPNEDSNSRQVYYIPHHAVVKADSSTTPLRVVFNASCRTSLGKSLKDHLLVGPKLQNELPAILIQWRQYPYVFTADSAKMYRQILLDTRDRDFQRILWRREVKDPITEYRLCTVTYGTAPASYLAQRVLQQLALDEGAEFPLALPIIYHQTYVDDFIFGADDSTLALATRDQLIGLLEKGGFRLRKWASNSPVLLQGIDPSDHGLASNKPFSDNDHLKVLGVMWNPASDALRFQINLRESPGQTKRAILSAIASLFDPLGLVAPVVIIAKILMQSLWASSCDWDDIIPESLLQKWIQYYSSLTALNSLSIPRWTHRDANTVQFELHGFSDASSQAYAAIVYCRVHARDGSITVTPLIAKSKVAPQKTISIPRLELSAALLLTRLLVIVRSALQISTVECHYWTDSTITLSWISSSPSQWQTFVANRVSEIQTSLSKATWHHVPTNENPADCASRGILGDELPSHLLWWRGPKWLIQSSEHWPLQPPHLSFSLVPEQRRSFVSHLNTRSEPWDFLTRFSSWPKLIRVTAYLLRYLNKTQERGRLRLSSQPVSVPGGNNFTLSVLEVKAAKIAIIRAIQRESFPDEIQRIKKGQSLSSSSPIASLTPFLDQSGLLRVAGRLRKSQLSEASKFPIIIRSHPTISLLISHHHARTLHGGPTLTLTSLREEYWLLRARSTVRSVLFKCVACTREQAITPTELMGELPAIRINQTIRAFVHTGLDYAGPVLVRNSSGRGHKSHKAYIALFICMTTKAIHLELVHDYGSASFVAAFHRFTSRRGIPQAMYSDNGTTFQGADRELTISYRKAIRDPNFLNSQITEAITWHFMPPGATHFGGLWEAGVRSVKHHVKRCVGRHQLTAEAFATLLCRVEACLNSRPIAQVSENLDDYRALTPGHFLIGTSLMTVPEPSVLELNEHRLSHWQTVQRISEAVWKAWVQDYLHILHQRPK